MITELGYTAGWLDSSIHDFLKDIARPFASIRFALITSLDSSRDLRTGEPLRALRSTLGAEVLGTGLLAPTRRLLDAEHQGPVFFGFDEVWFFPGRPRVAKPDSVVLVGPSRIDQAMLARAAPWMKQTSCTLGLGDGTGLNFTAKVQGLGRYLVAHSASQPAPSR